MMQQYHDLKAQIPQDTLLLFRLGDFYELFFNDAVIASRLLGLTLTQRHGATMAGIPHHALAQYSEKLLAAGKKVAICDQQEAPKPGKLVPRTITRILTPGTHLQALEGQHTQALVALQPSSAGWGLAWLDVTTGKLQLAQAPFADALMPLLEGLDPKEWLLPSGADWEQAPQWQPLAQRLAQGLVSRMPEGHWDCTQAYGRVTQALGVASLQAWGLDSQHPGLAPAAALLAYAQQSLGGTPQHLELLSPYAPQHTLVLDADTLRSLEVFRSLEHTRQGSLLQAIDHTVTAAGARLLQQYLMHPQHDLQEISRRQACVGALVADPDLATCVRAYLERVRDVPRMLTRLEHNMRSPRELGAIRDTLAAIGPLQERLLHSPEPALQQLAQALDPEPALCQHLRSALLAELPADCLQGGYIAPGYCPELDALRAVLQDQQAWLLDFEQKQQERSGIKSLKVRYTQAFGYFIEVTKANLHLVPKDYTRKQTLTQGERYTHEALRKQEQLILSAQSQSLQLEQQCLGQLIEATVQRAGTLLRTFNSLAQLDVFVGWSVLARRWHYSCPQWQQGAPLRITAGRHPIVEQGLGGHSGPGFVPNDTYLDSHSEQVIVLTGPNMAGKSTYIRQVALIALMAHLGCWVPAQQCSLGLIDRIFTRIGAGDKLSQGQSTFMVEMCQTAHILRHATPRSLVVLDEVGRGTSTYDGLSLAWAILEHLHGPQDGPKTLFATHYHELTQLEALLPRVRNYTVLVQEYQDQVVFAHQVRPGAATRSYGIHVARLAGLPPSLIERAKAILTRLEKHGPGSRRSASLATSDPDAQQLGLFQPMPVAT
jgi:DNA mismatch repair protein MutS